MNYLPAARPTLHFVGVSTASSSIMRVFPAWARHLGLADASIAGIDFPLHAPPTAYRDAVRFIAADPLSVGALVTTHKIDLFSACRDIFDVVDPHAVLMHEVSCISKTAGKLVCHAKDPISSGLALDSFLPAQHFARTGAEVFVMGAGGSSIALTWHLLQPGRGTDRPSRIVVSDRSPERLEEIRRVHAQVTAGSDAGPRLAYLHVASARDNDRVLAGLAPGSLAINATGLGKDAPGSPLTDDARFPQRGIAWDLNYRGELVFLAQARKAAAAQDLQVEDGWTYFIHGWTQVIAETFHIAIPTKGAAFDALSRIAAEVGRA